MSRISRVAGAFLSAASFAAASVGSAQNFEVDKWNIGGDGSTDYLTAEAGTGLAFVSRGTHVMVVDGFTGKVLGDIADTPRTHGIAIDPDSRNIVGTTELEDVAPEGAAANGKGWIYVNNEGKNTIQVIDVKTWTPVLSWPLAPCEGPGGIAYDRATDRIFAGCGKISVVVHGASGKVVATITNGEQVDALGRDPVRKLIYIPCGTPGNVVVAHQDSPDKYAVVATAATMRGAKTFSVDPVAHRAYLFQPKYGPPPAPPPGAAAPAMGGRGGPRGPIIGAWFFAIKQ